VVSPAVRVVDRVRDQADWSGTPSSGLVVYDAVAQQFRTSAALGVKKYYASLLGCPGDGDPITNAGTDVTAVLQSVLTGGKAHLVIDVPCLFDSLFLESYTTLECVADGLLVRKGPPNGGRTCITNLHYVAGPTAPTDQFITLLNVKLDGSRRFNGSGNDGSNPLYNSAFLMAVASLDGWGVNGIGFYGVRWLRVINTRVDDPPAYGLNLGNVQDAYVEGFSKWHRYGDGQPTDCVIQLQGHCRRILLVNTTGTAFDDGLALNANDGQDNNPGAAPGPYPNAGGPGPIDDVTIRGVGFDAVKQALRMISASQDAQITNVLAEGVRAVLGCASLGLDAYGYAGALLQTFNIGGPLVDGTRGRMTGITLRNWLLEGNATGSGPGFAPVHIEQTNVYRLLVENVRPKVYASPQIATVYQAANASVTGMTVVRLLDERQVAGLPAVDLNGPFSDVDVIDCEYDQSKAGSSAPQPSFDSPATSFWPTSMVRVAGAGAAGALRVSGYRTAGLSHVIECVGRAPSSVLLGPGRHGGALGGAAVKSDTALPSLTVDPAADADFLVDVPDGSIVNVGSDPTGTFNGWHQTRYFRGLWIGTAGTNVSAYTPEGGHALQAAVGSGLTKLSGLSGSNGYGTLYPGGASSFNALAAADQPAAGDAFTVHFVHLRRGAVPSGEYSAVTLFATSAASLADVFEFRVNLATIDVAHNGAVVQFSGTVPAVGKFQQYRVHVFPQEGSTEVRIVVETSADGGRTWAVPMPTSYVNTSLAPIVGPRFVTAAGGTASTWHHIGPVIVTDCVYPDPGAYVPSIPTAALDWDFSTGTYQDAARTTAASANNDPVGGVADQSGNGHHGAQATSGKRGLLIVPGLNGLPVLRLDGTDDFISVANYAPNPPCYIIGVVKFPTTLGASGKEILGIGGNAANGRIGLFYDTARHLGVESSGGYQNSAETVAAGWHIVEVRMTTTALSGLEIWVDGTALTMSGGTGTINNVAPVETCLGTIPTQPASGYETAGDYAQLQIYTSAPSDADRGTIRAARATKWGL
jgi:hypothetical protein